MATIRRCTLLAAAVALLATPGFALPQLERPYPLPANFSGVITVYPDNDNTTAVRRYWIIPSLARICRKQNGKLAFGLVHSGVSSFDVDGINALLDASFQPYVDDKTLNEAKKLIETEAKKDGATSVSFNFVVPTETTIQMLVGGQFFDWNGNTKTVVKGGSVEACIPFQVKVKDSFDVRALTQAGGPDAATFGALFTMKFRGVGNRFHATVTAKFEETYKHLSARVKASGWFGLVNADLKYEWQELLKSGAVTYKIWEGTEDQLKQFNLQFIFETLFKAMTERTGAFAQQLKPGGLPDAPGGGGFWGFSLSAGGGFEQYTDKTDIVVDVDAQFTREQELVFGMNFPSGGAELVNYVKNLTDTGKPFPTADDFKQQKAQHQVCRTNNLAALKKLHDEGTIDDQTYRELVAKAIERGCYVDYTVADTKMLKAWRAEGNEVPLGLALEISRRRRSQ